jgi:hypothetical protein
MGKGGANPYPMWWASSDEPITRDRPDKNKLPDYYKSQRDRDKEYYDQYYKEKSYSERRREFEEDFKKRFMQGEFFEQKDFVNINPQPMNDIHPIFKIKKSSSEEDFKKQYKKLILKHHPDKGGDSSMFIKIKEAWDNLFFNN